MRRTFLLSLTVIAALPRVIFAQNDRVQLDSVSVRIEASDLPGAVQLLGQYLDRPVVFVGSSAAVVTLETPRPIPRGDMLRLLRGLVESHGFELVDDSATAIYRVRQRQMPAQSTVTPAPTPPRRDEGPELFVISLRHARAEEVAMTVNALYGHQGRGESGGEGSPQTLGQELRENLVAPAGTVIPLQSASGGRVAMLSGELTVVPEPRGNSLLVRANRSDFELVRSLVERIDVRPLQVLIEVLIAEVRRDRSLGVGVQGRVGETPVGQGSTSVSGSLGSQGLGDFVVKVMGVGGIDADLTLSMGSQQGEVRILSRPVVLATNNQVASIIVGSQRPFVQVQRALPTDAASRDQIVQYKEVGTKLTVRPSISADGAVQLDVTQEVSSATAETAFNAPVISTRSIQTQLLVRDGQTVALGGLTDRQRDQTRRGVPILASLPWLGGLFGSSERRTTETELFVFLTPRVIRTDEEAASASQPYEERTRERRPEMPDR